MPPIGSVQLLGTGDRLRAEVEPDGAKTELGQEGGLMAATTARHQHPSRWQWAARVGSQKLLQWRRRPTQLPAIGALAVTLIPGD